MGKCPSMEPLSISLPSSKRTNQGGKKYILYSKLYVRVYEMTMKSKNCDITGPDLHAYLNPDHTRCIRVLNNNFMSHLLQLKDFSKMF